MAVLQSFLLALAAVLPLFSSSYAYFMPNSTGLRMTHGFETILVQPYGYDGFRVRAWPFRPPTGDEISFLYDPPAEGPTESKSQGLEYDQISQGHQFKAIRNGDCVFKTFGYDGTGNWRLGFYRINPDGSEDLLTNEYSPTKALNSRYYSWTGNGYEFSAAFSFSTDPDEMIFGTGTQQDHMINKKGNTIDLINFNTHIPTPLFMSSRGYGFVWNSASEGRMEFGMLRNRFTSDSTTLVDYAIVAGKMKTSKSNAKGAPDYDLLQRRLSAMTGRAPKPPNFSLGYIQSKLRYENQSEVILLAHHFREHQIPVSMIVIDYQSWAAQGDWALDPRLWPNVSYMSSEVKRITGAEMMASLWPSVADNSYNYGILQANGWLSATRSGPGTTDSWNGSYIRNYDSTNPKAREFLWQNLRDHYYRRGIKNFWIDQADGGALGEGYENNGQSTYMENIPYPLPDALYAAGTQKSVGKLYPWAHQAAIEEGLRNVTNTKMGQPCDSLSLSRSGYIGSQRFCSIIWSGDTTAIWSTLSAQPASGLSAASTGWGWWTVDAGGFQADATIPWSNNISDPRYRHLYVRWQQWTTFLPFMRNHGSRSCLHLYHYTCNNEPWTYGSSNTPIIKSYIQLRYKLRPYLKSIFDKFSSEGRMIMRPLFVDFAYTDKKLEGMLRRNDNYTTQQYMFGPRLLVTPVTLPDVETWDVYLPRTEDTPGTVERDGQGSGEDVKVDEAMNKKGEWTYWWTNKTYAGGQVVKVPAPLEHIPLFYLGKRDDIFSGNVF